MASSRFPSNADWSENRTGIRLTDVFPEIKAGLTETIYAGKGFMSVGKICVISTGRVLKSTNVNKIEVLDECIQQDGQNGNYCIQIRFVKCGVKDSIKITSHHKRTVSLV